MWLNSSINQSRFPEIQPHIAVSKLSASFQANLVQENPCDLASSSGGSIYIPGIMIG